ncbi:MAG: hypothetical protein ACI8TL_000681 [Natronomonas sp.]|jgi:hypothetical protein
MKRRTLLAVAGAATVPAGAGCLDGADSPDDDDREGNETADPGSEVDDGSDGGDTTEPGGQPLFEDSFSATSQGGFLAIGEDTDSRSQAREAGYLLPDGEEVLTLEAAVSADGSWESTDVSFPPVETGFGIEAAIELPDGLSGVVFEDRMTASGTLRVVIDNPEGEFSFDIEATSERSGSLEGEANFEEEPLRATLVDNEFVIEADSGSILIDSQLGLPADEPGTNWFEIDIELTR